MRRLFFLLSLLIVVAGCTSDSSLPNPTGKGTVRGINAIKGSPDIVFLIEERLIESLAYKSISGPTRWDDFQYAFNFDVLILGESSRRRVASINQKIDPDRDYTLVASGALTSPTITVWESDDRTFGDADTIFELSLAHASQTLGDVDVYLAADGVAPVLGEQLGTLGFGEILAPTDIESANFVLTVTPANDPSTVLYQSSDLLYGARAAFTLVLFDGDETDLAPYSARRFSKGGGIAVLPDSRFPPTLRFLQASLDLPPSDIYNDEMLTNRLVTNHVFGDVTGEIEIAIGANEFTYTPFDDTGVTLLSGSLSSLAGNKYNFFVLGDDGAQATAAYVPIRRSVSTSARIQFLHTAFNHGFLDLYLVEPGVAIDEDVLPAQVLTYGLLSSVVAVEAGTYDFYVTTREEKTIVAGPLQLDVVLGDVIEAIILDTVDPATAELRVIPAP